MSDDGRDADSEGRRAVQGCVQGSGGPEGHPEDLRPLETGLPNVSEDAGQ